jgi:hypothetical protein
MPAGRPESTLFDLPEKWKAIAMDIYSQGGSDVEVKVALAIPPAAALSNSLWDRFMEQEPEFSQTIMAGRLVCQQWWEKQGRIATFGGIEGFNATAFIFNMKNRFKADWKDKHETELTGKDGGKIEHEVAVPGLSETLSFLGGIKSSGS